ncbi:MAG: hypothetical protein JW869_08285, partial [Candidatus Omnitrophica bacterium]|nr:hypothetical protein [Candidatus Omnitrophota bacterium]
MKMVRCLVLFFVVLCLFSPTALWAEEALSLAMSSALDLLEARAEEQSAQFEKSQDRKIAIAQALDQAQEYVLSETYGQPAKVEDSNIALSHIPSSQNIFSDFYVTSPFENIWQGLKSLSPICSYSLFDDYYDGEDDALYDDESGLSFSAGVWYLAQGDLTWITSTNITKSQLTYANDGLM